MTFAQPLVPGVLIRRYKRFLADVELDSGETVTAHCANPGAMTGLNMSGLRIWLEPNDDPKRKLKYSWKLAELPGGHWAGIDTSLPNRIVGDALRAGEIEALSGYSEARPEVRYGDASRVDFLLTAPERSPCYVEVKNVHLRRSGDTAEFPDSVTKRGAKHLEELAKVASSGERAVMLYFVQRTDCAKMRLSADIDPVYAAAHERASAAGVETLVFSSHISRESVSLGPRIDFDPNNASGSLDGTA